MKTISTILAAILCSSAPLVAQDGTLSSPTEQTSQNSLQMGKETISNLRQAYQNGEYAQFLKEMDDAYQTARSENQLSGLSDMRVSQFPEMKDADKWEETAATLRQEKNQQLLSVISDEDDSAFAKKVRSAAANISTSDQEKALAQLSLFRLMAPNSGKSADENRIIDLDLEYEFKVLHMSRPVDGESSSSQKRLNQYVLQMEKSEKLAEISKTFQDSSLKQTIGIASSNIDERLSQNWDQMDLTSLARGKIKASNEQEEKIASILSSYQEKFNDQFQQYLESQPVAQK